MNNRLSKFTVFCFEMADLVILNVIFIICCIPIFTIGAALTGLYYTTIRMSKGMESSPIYKDFFKSFKENFKQSTIVWLIILLAGVFVAVDIFLVTNLDGGRLSSLLAGVLVIAGIIIVFIASYVFPMISYFKNTNLAMIRNSFIVSTAKIGCTIPIAIMNLTPLMVIFVPGEAIKWFLAAYTFIWFSGVARLNSKMISKVLTELEGTSAKNEMREVKKWRL